MVREQSHVQACESLEDAFLFKGELSPVRNGWSGSHQRHFASVLCEQFGKHAAHVVMVVVVDENFLESVGLPTAFQQQAVGVQKVIGCENISVALEQGAR